MIFECEGPADFTDGKGSLGEFILDRLAVGGDKVALVSYLGFQTRGIGVKSLIYLETRHFHAPSTSFINFGIHHLRGRILFVYYDRRKFSIIGRALISNLFFKSV